MYSNLYLTPANYLSYEDVRKTLKTSYTLWETFIEEQLNKLNQRFLNEYNLELYFVSHRGYVLLPKDFKYKRELEYLVRDIKVLISPNIVDEVNKVVNEYKVHNSLLKEKIEQEYEKDYNEFLKTKKAKEILIKEYIKELDVKDLTKEEFDFLSDLALKTR